MKEKVLEAFRELGFEVEDFGDDYLAIRDRRLFFYSYGENEEKCLSIYCFVPYDCGEFNIFQLYTLSERLNASLTCIKAYMNGNTLCLAYERGLIWDDEDLKAIISNAVVQLDEGFATARELLDEVEKMMTDENGEPLTLGEQLDGHECVDLGLSVKWAMCNVGANTHIQRGSFYAWGETDMKNEYDEAGSKTFGKEMENIAGDPLYDVAQAKWGGSWRMPTMEEVNELTDNCVWTWTTINGVCGCKVTSRINGNSVFFPAGGRAKEDYYTGSGVEGFYWSSTPHIDKNKACAIFFQRPSFHACALADRFWGGTVRPVSEL